MTESPEPENKNSEPFRVLARKYRPTTFSELIGQDAMVRILTSAIESGRLAHAFILTGVRGTGKTTTARIIARALNCTGRGGGGPTSEPCGVCEHCRAITGDRHVDVIEMDAASRTGVDDIRELIEAVRYKPVSARYKVYIIDEVHMLSKNAFNALLKTLEEPPEHVKFIFATTEVRKLPVTVLSRCQRFDLRRVGLETLAAHLTAIAEKEESSISPQAATMIARAADGSVRDGLSLLDTAISHAKGEVNVDQVRGMLGLGDRSRIFDLMDSLMRGDPAAALEMLDEAYESGADPLVVIQDLLEVCHWLTRLKVFPDAGLMPDFPETEAKRGREMADKLAMPVLTRAWQLLLKGLKEVQDATSPLIAAEMVLVRLAYAAHLPSPAEIIRSLQDVESGHRREQESASSCVAPSPAAGSVSAGSCGADGGADPGVKPQPDASSSSPPGSSAQAALATGPELKAVDQHMPEAAPDLLLPGGAGDDGVALVDVSRAPGEGTIVRPTSFRDVVELAKRNRETVLQGYLEREMHVVSFEPGRIEFRPGANAPPNLARRLSDYLGKWTGERWVVSVSQARGEATLHEQDKAAAEKARFEAQAHPLVRAVLDAFPGASVSAVRDLDSSPGRLASDDDLSNSDGEMEK